MHREYTSRCILTKENNQHFTKWEEGALYSHPLSSLTTRHMKHGNVEARKLCVIEYYSMTHT